MPSLSSKSQAITGRRIRLPLSLLYSRHHSPLSVAAYALLDVMGGADRCVESSRTWIAGRLDCSLGGISKALSKLATGYQAAGADPGAPVLMVSWPRGKGLTAERVTIPGVPFVDVPEWTLGDDVDGPVVTHRAWRLYAILVHKRAPGRTSVTLPRRDLAQLLRARADSLPALLRELVDAGMVVALERPGATTVLHPVLRRLDRAALDLVRAQLAAEGDPAEHRPTPLADDDRPDPSTGSSPHPRAGTSPHPFAETANKRTDLSGEDLKDPGGEPARTPPGHTGTPKTHGRGDTGSPISHARQWCLACEGRTRRVINPDTGALGGPCPTCHPNAQERAA